MTPEQGALPARKATADGPGSSGNIAANSVSRPAAFGYLAPGWADRYRLRSFWIFEESVRDAQMSALHGCAATALIAAAM
jgi:hypothetical protein